MNLDGKGQYGSFIHPLVQRILERSLATSATKSTLNEILIQHTFNGKDEGVKPRRRMEEGNPGPEG